ncbi:MAG: hypothetical protein KIS67_17400 [Verrucomicrobiae bacterium]|nr:hypothetical protein [Verrucomicrobiae bacterium]
MTFSSISGSTAIWTGTATYWNTPFTTTSTSTRFTATITSGAVSWVNAGSVSGFTLAQAAALGAVVDNSSGQPYSVLLEFFALQGSTWIALNSFDNLYDYGSGTHSDVYGGFYYAAPVPEPTTMVAGSLLLLPFGMSMIRFLRKQRPS